MSREAGQGRRGAGPLQARELAPTGEHGLQLPHTRARQLKAVVQRVSRASVRVGGETVGEIGPGLLVLLAVARGDAPADVDRLAAKIANLRIFEDDARKFDRSVVDAGGAVLAVSQFTLLGDSKRQKGTRPDFSQAAPRDEAEPIYDAFCEALCNHGIRVEAGVFGARMDVELVNDGPVTLILES